MTTIFRSIICPLCNNKVITLSANRIFNCCDHTFLVVPEGTGFIIKEITIIRKKCCDRKIHIIIKKVF